MNHNQHDDSSDIAEALRGLRPIEPDALALARWQRAAQAQARPVRRATRWQLPLALAAGTLLAIGAWRIAAVNPAADDVSVQPVTALAPALEANRQLPTYVAQTALLAQILASMPDNGRVLSVERATAIATLEDQLVLLDSAIRNPPALVSRDMHSQLWRERLGVMSTLVTLKQNGSNAVYL